MKSNRKFIEKLVVTAILAALVIVLQLFVVFPVGIFTITLTLVPIMVGAVLYGPKTGAFLGGVFGITVSAQVIFPLLDPLSLAMFDYSPVATIAICILKGVLAGLVAGLIYKPFKNTKKETLGIILSAISCPIINTGLFLSALVLIFYDVAVAYATETGFPTLINFIVLGILLNFSVEFVIQVLLIPLVIRLMKILKITTT